MELAIDILLRDHREISPNATAGCRMLDGGSECDGAAGPGGGAAVQEVEDWRQPLPLEIKIGVCHVFQNVTPPPQMTTAGS